MPNEFIVKNGLVVGGNVVTSGTITINGALAATQSWVTSQAYLTSASLSGYATQSYVTSAISALVDAAPAALDTLNELAAALGDDANFSTTITNSIASKLSLTGGTLTGALNGTSASFSSNVTLGNNADLVFQDLAGTFPTTGKGFDWTLNNDGARIYAVQPGSDSIDLVFQLRDNATTNDRFVFWVDEWQGPAYDKYPLIISGGTQFDLKDSALYTNTVLRLSNSGVLQNVTGNISMFTNNAGYLTSYTETDTLATVTGRGATTSTNISVNTINIGTDATYGGAYRSVSFGYNGDGSNRIFAANNTSDGMYFAAATGQGFNFRPNGGTANLVVINSSGNVGVGTSSPAAVLHSLGTGIVNIVQSSNDVSYTQYYNTSTGDGGTGNGFTVGVNGLDAYVFNREISNLILGTADTERIRITSTGNVGIGTTSPSAKLDVSGTVITTSTLGSTAGSYAIDHSGINTWKIGVTATNSSTFHIGNDTGGSFVNKILNITAGGNIGIGTTSPTAALQISTRMRLYSDGVLTWGASANNGTLTWDTGKAIVKGQVGNELHLGANNQNSQLVITSGGNVGIGTSSPAYKLDVRSSLATIAMFDGTYAGIQGIQVQRNGGDNVRLTANYSGYGGGLESSDALRFSVNGADISNPSMYIETTGNVGIGTTAPAQKLDVAGGVATTAGYLIYDAGGVVRNVLNIDASNDLYLQTGTTSGSRSIILSTEAVERMRVNALGNVGIGTTSPSEKLHVAGSSVISYSATNANYFGQANSGFGYGYIRPFNSSGLFAFDTNYTPGGGYDFAYNGSSVIRINSSGNVGIGTTAPSGALHVYSGGSERFLIGGDVNVAGSTDLNITGANRRFSFTNGTGTIRTTNATSLFLQTNSTTAVTIDSSQNVGIGTASPAFKLHVLGTGGGDSTFTGGILIDNNNATDGESTLAFRVNSMVAAGNYWLTGLNQTNSYSIAYGTSFTDANTLFRVSSNGNVGIGTTSPGAKLHVSGGGQYISASASATAFLRLYSNAQTSSQFEIGQGFATTTDNIAYLWNAANASMAFGTNSTERLRITSTGNVGIGTTSPPQKLSVFGNIYQRTGDFITWSNGDAQIGAVFGYNLAFSTYDGSSAMLERMRITSAGNVGIGTTSPSTALTVNGVITATSGNSTNWNTAYSWGNHASASYATTSYVTTQINNLINGAPGVLDTLDELAAALGDDANFATTVTNSIATKAPLASPALTGTPTAPTASTATNSTQIATTAYVKNQGYITGVTNISGYSGTLLAEDNRTISPSELTANRLGFGFTSWTNNNAAPYADFLHLRSYGDTSGGNDNLVMFRKDAIGMRIYQQAFGSGTAYSTFKDVAFTDSSITGNAATATTLETARTIGGVSFNGSANINLPGVNTTGNQNTTGSAATLTTARTLTIGNTGKTFNGEANVSWSLAEIGAQPAGSYADASHTHTSLNSVNFNNGDLTNINSIQIGDPGPGEGLIFNGGNGWKIYESPNDLTTNTGGNLQFVKGTTRVMTLDTSNNVYFLGSITASGYNDSNWNTAYGWGNHASAGYALDSSLANYLPLSGGVIGGGVTINGNLTVNGTITENSSLKLKENVETSEGNLEKVVNLRPVTYNKIGSQTTELGLIAEEVAEVYPEFVQYDENGEPIGVHYSRLTAALIGAVKELNEQLQELKRNK